MKNIIIYTKTGCPWCREALDFLNKNSIKYEEREVLGNKKYFDELVEKSKQSKTPTLDIEGYILADTDASQIEQYFKSINML